MRVVIAALALAGCYRPSIAACQYACDNESCPSGLVCSAGMCVGSAGDTCEAGDARFGDPTGDGPHDVNLGEAGCSFGYSVSNIDPCSFASAGQDWIVAHDTTFSDSPDDTGDPPPAGSIHLVEEGGGHMVAVVFVRSLDVMAGATLRVTIAPVIVFSDSSATVDGAIELAAPVTTCDGSGQGNPGQENHGTSGAGGGGGGSFGARPFATIAGARGGDGGGNGGDAGGAGGDAGHALQDTSLVPLVTGCPGAGAGSAEGIPGVPGGLGGGAIQISARGSIVVTGQIRASGGGGVSGGSDASAGGGGGSGGAILLEAGSSIDLAQGFLCANGGGGGASASFDFGDAGQCAASAAPGAPSDTASGDGGAGESSSVAAIPGGAGAAGNGGGGGGGGVGIIRLNAPAILHMINASPPAVAN